jgi:hypothetical protein
MTAKWSLKPTWTAPTLRRCVPADAGGVNRSLVPPVVLVLSTVPASIFAQLNAAALVLLRFTGAWNMHGI